MAPPGARTRKSRSASTNVKRKAANANTIKNLQPTSILARTEKPAAGAPAKPKPIPAAVPPVPDTDATKDTNNVSANEEESTAPAVGPQAQVPAPALEGKEVVVEEVTVALAVDKQTEGPEPETVEIDVKTLTQETQDAAVPRDVSAENPGSNRTNGDPHPDSPRTPSSPPSSRVSKPSSGVENESDGRKEDVDVGAAGAQGEKEKESKTGTGHEDEPRAEQLWEAESEREQDRHRADDGGGSLEEPPSKRGDPESGTLPLAPAAAKQVEQEVKLEKQEQEAQNASANDPNANANNDGDDDGKAPAPANPTTTTAEKSNPRPAAATNANLANLKEDVKNQMQSGSGPSKNSNSNPPTSTGRFKLALWPPSPVKRNEKENGSNTEKEALKLLKEVKVKTYPPASACGRGPSSPASAPATKNENANASANASAPVVTATEVTGVMAKAVSVIVAAATAKPYVVKKAVEAAAAATKGKAPLPPLLLLAPCGGCLFPAPPNRNRHQLHYAWTLWYQNTKSGINWKDSFKPVYTFSVVETFWAVLDRIRGPSDLTHGSSLYLFKQGIKPDWEDKHLRNGGRWIVMNDIKCRDALDKIWLEVMMLLIGEVFGDDGDEICGAGLDIRAKGDKIAVWTVNSKNKKAIMNIGHHVKERLEPLPNFAPQRQRMMYELHEDPGAGAGEKQNRCLYSLNFVLKSPGFFPYLH